MKTKPSSGLSLIELMVAIAIISIISLFVPPLSGLMAKHRLANSESDLRLLIGQARATALTLQQRTTLCPLNSDFSCSSKWTSELSVFTDHNGNRKLDDGEKVLQVMKVNPAIRIQWLGMKPANSLHFGTQGVTFVSNGTFSLCSFGFTETIKLIVNRQGRTRSERIEKQCPANSTT